MTERWHAEEGDCLALERRIESLRARLDAAADSATSPRKNATAGPDQTKQKDPGTSTGRESNFGDAESGGSQNGNLVQFSIIDQLTRQPVANNEFPSSARWAQSTSTSQHTPAPNRVTRPPGSAGPMATSSTRTLRCRSARVSSARSRRDYGSDKRVEHGYEESRRDAGREAAFDRVDGGVEDAREDVGGASRAYFLSTRKKKNELV